MLHLCLSILFSSVIFIIFKLYGFYKVQTSYAIVANYVVACCVGLLFTTQSFSIRDLLMKEWLPGTLALGILFIVVFNIMAKTSQQMGISVASVATKMSFVIPVISGLIIYNEHLGSLRVLGILMALAAVYFTSFKKKNAHQEKHLLLLPVLLFLGSGIIDASIKYMEASLVSEEELALFSATVFGAAAFTGLISVLASHRKKKLRFSGRNVVAGIALGVPNYFSIFFLLKALDSSILNSAAVFTINNVAIVMFSTLLGMQLFKEQISRMNWAGIGLAIVSISLVILF